jgi:hypothetical protein
VVKAVARRLNGGGPCMVVVHIFVKAVARRLNGGGPSMVAGHIW